MTIDHDEVLRARVLLLGSGRPSRAQLLGAYRVLAEVSPNAYLPKLVDALLALRHESRDPEVEIALAAEASRAARVIEVGAPDRAERLRRALDAYQASLFALGRRAEGRAICAQLAAAGRTEGGLDPTGRCAHGAGRVGALVDHCGGRPPAAGAGSVRRAESRAAVSAAAGEPSRR
ncbi:hypothetical protein [Streptomyces sp. CAS3]